MRLPRALTSAVLGGVLTTAALALPGAAAADAARPYIVVFERSSAAAARVATSEIARDQDLTTTQRYDDAVHGFAARLDGADVRDLKADPRVAQVVPDTPVRALGLVALTAGDNIPTGVRRVGAAVGTTVRQASTANVAVVDTGVDLTHPDLNAVAGTNCTGSGAPQDDNGHGTHVAGIIGAKNQGSGAVGVAPGTKIWAVKVLNASGAGYMSQIVCGIDWVTSTRTDANPNNDISVVNMSLGGLGSPSANCGTSVGDVEHMAICRATAAGVTFVVAAGNSAADEQGFEPANVPEALTVTSVSDSDGLPGGAGPALSSCGLSDPDDQVASYSNYATRAAEIAHTIAAPGTCIRSTYPGGRYATMSGTSMAAPHVAGLVALCLGENGAHGPCWGKTPAQIDQMMLDAAGTTAARGPQSAFNGSPSRPFGSRFYGDLASTDFPSASGAVPAVTTGPAVTGTPVTGQTLTATQGTWTGAANTYTYQWLRCTTAAAGTCSAIAGATAATYVPVAADVARLLRVRVVASDADGAALALSAATAAVTAPVVAPPSATVAPSLSGFAIVGRTLTVAQGTWTGAAPIAYATQWLRCPASTVAGCTAIPGATAATYLVTLADRGMYLRAAVTATNAKAAVTIRTAPTAAVTSPPAPAVTAAPAINGAAAAGSTTVGATLSASSGSWSGGPTAYAYQWLRCADATAGSCAAIAGATSASYVSTTADRGRVLRVQVTARNDYGSATTRSNTMTIR